MADNNEKIENMIEELENTLRKLEDENISLEDSFALYKNGMDTLKKCQDKLDEVAKNVELLSSDGSFDGNLKVVSEQ